jgi:hypothetical protein
MLASIRYPPIAVPMALLWNCLQQVRNGAAKIHASPVAVATAVAERGTRASAGPVLNAGPARHAPVLIRRKETAA